MPEENDRSLGDLFGDLGRQVGTLVRRELDLARVELNDRATRIGRDLATVAAGGAVLHGAVLVLLAAAVFGLIELGLEAWLAASIVGIVVGVAGAILLRAGLKAMRSDSSAPSATIETMRDNVEWAKEQTK